MVDRLQDKVANDVVADAAHSCIHRQFEHPFDTTSEQVQYLDGRIGDFAAAFEDATGCHPSHPVYAACQVTLTADIHHLSARTCLAYATWPSETRCM